VTFLQGMPGGFVSVYADGAELIRSIVFTTTIAPVPLKPGTRTIALPLAQASATSTPVLYEDLLVTSGECASVIVILTVAAEPARSSLQTRQGRSRRATHD
jgi:hypothetical protein